MGAEDDLRTVGHGCTAVASELTANGRNAVGHDYFHTGEFVSALVLERRIRDVRRGALPVDALGVARPRGASARSAGPARRPSRLQYVFAGLHVLDRERPVWCTQP